MILSINKSYKSFKQSFQTELPDFTILTGINGSGKTQILNGIAEGAMTLNDENNQIINKPGHTLSVDSRALTPPDYNAVSNDNIIEAPNAIWTRIKLWQERSSVATPGNKNTTASSLYTYVGDQDEPVVRYIIETSGVNPDLLTRDHVIDYYPGFDASGISTVFNQNLALLFARYHERWVNNQFKQFLREKKGISSYGFLTESDFISLYGEHPPWTTLNSILKDVGLNFSFNFPNSFHRAPFELKLINNKNGAEIKFSDLSSGERVVMSLVFATYTSNHQFQFPKVLLMDEPDASLHPSMARLFLRTVKNLFVEKHGVKVIMTTHSAASVALSDEESLFVVSATDPRIQKVNKDQALISLNQNVPSFSVNYENRKQVFTESHVDAECFDHIYNELLPKLQPDVSLHFISSGSGGNGSCDQVREVVNMLTRHGNKSIFGIIDRDEDTAPTKHIKVLGSDRHSLENYVFDPLVLGTFLIRERCFSEDDMLALKKIKHSQVINLNKNELQVLVDLTISKLSINLEHLDMTPKKSIYISGKEVSVPSWYFNKRGHDLEELIAKEFHPLQKFKKDLKKNVVKNVMCEFPDMIPIDFLDLFREIQTN